MLETHSPRRSHASRPKPALSNVAWLYADETRREIWGAKGWRDARVARQLIRIAILLADPDDLPRGQ